MEPTVPLFKQPRHTPDLKTGKLYSLEWVKEKSPSFALQYALVKKQSSGYDIYGVFDTASEAFSARRQWVKENGDRKVFIRATPAAPKQPARRVYEADDVDFSETVLGMKTSLLSI